MERRPCGDRRVRDRALTAGVFAVAAFVVLAGLGAYGLWDPDEGRHAAIARAVYGSSTWRGLVVPTHNFAAYHDKPILYDGIGAQEVRVGLRYLLD